NSYRDLFQRRLSFYLNFRKYYFPLRTRWSLRQCCRLRLRCGRDGSGECKRVPLLEGCDIVCGFVSGAADQNEVGLQESHAFGYKLQQRRGGFRGDAGMYRVLKNMGKFGGDLRKQRKAIGRRCSCKRVGRYIEPLQLKGCGICIKQNVGILAQVLEAVGRLLKEYLHEFCAVVVQALSCAATVRCNVAGF